MAWQNPQMKNKDATMTNAKSSALRFSFIFPFSVD
jgi:hypothetical protein